MLPLTVIPVTAVKNMNGEFAHWYSTSTFGNMVSHICFKTMNMVTNSFSNIGFIYAEFTI